MEKNAGQKRAVDYLYPPIEPYAQQMLDVGQDHVLYVEQCGNPKGIPVVVLHGGPGGGCSPAMRRYFDPRRFRVILFDQRGCGRSRPHASVKDNTTWHLVRDIEKIRLALGISTWHVFGGSWGATLGLVYTQTHRDAVLSLILRGVFLGTQKELDWFYGGGAAQFWPDAWDRFASIIPASEHDDLIGAYNRRLFSGDLTEEVRFARAWASWENALASIESNGAASVSAANYARAFARLENHYFHNKVFLSAGQGILENMDALRNVPGVIVQGRYDMICPPTSAWTLSKSWKAANLHLVGKAGHAVSEPGISKELVRYMNSV